LRASTAEPIETAHLRHTDVGDRGVVKLGADRFERLGSSADAADVVTPLGEGFLQQFEDRGFVVDDEDLGDFHGLDRL